MYWGTIQWWLFRTHVALKGYFESAYIQGSKDGIPPQILTLDGLPIGKVTVNCTSPPRRQATQSDSWVCLHSYNSVHACRNSNLTYIPPATPQKNVDIFIWLFWGLVGWGFLGFFWDVYFFG